MSPMTRDEILKALEANKDSPDTITFEDCIQNPELEPCPEIIAFLRKLASEAGEVDELLKATGLHPRDVAHLSWGELLDIARTVKGGLARLGVTAYQLPTQRKGAGRKRNEAYDRGWLLVKQGYSYRAAFLAVMEDLLQEGYSADDKEVAFERFKGAMGYRKRKEREQKKD